MLLSLNWIREYVDLNKLTDREVTDLITIRTAELDGAHQWGAHLKAMVSVEVLKVEAIQGKKVSLVTVKQAGGETLTVICGATNVRVGMITALAPVGSELPDGTKVQAKEIQGIVSKGFLCSEAELSLGADDDGIIDLPSDTPVGVPISTIFPDAVDTVIEIDNKSLTHRPDLWCHYGFAREVATIFNVQLKNPFTKEWHSSVLSRTIAKSAPITPAVDASACLGYLCASIDGVTVGASPAWMRQRLHRVGIRAINTAVDIGNYVMLELGIPLHLFDRDLIHGSKVFIKTLSAPASIELLDDSKAELVAGDTVISDEEGPLLIAGIMGGKRSGVSDATQRLLLEVANWSPSAVRKTSLRIGTRTESSLRYEKSLDSQLIERTAIRALDFIMQLSPDAKIIGELCTAQMPTKTETPKISLSVDYVRRILGADVPEAEVTRILSGLGFGVSGSGDSLQIDVPSYRATKDVSCDMDIIEEVGRMWGYEKIPPTSPQFNVLPIRMPVMKRLQRTLADFMVYGGRAFEVMTYPLIGEEVLKKAQWPDLNPSLVLKNAWSTDSDRMRPSIIPSSLNALVLNQKNFSSFRYFEMGRSYRAEGDFCQEHEELVITLFDRNERNFVAATELVESVLSITHNYEASLVELSDKAKSFVSLDWIGLIPGMAYEIQSPKGTLGVVFEVSPELLRSLKIRGNASIAVLNLNLLAELSTFDPRGFEPINYFPSTSLDVTVVAGARIPVADVLKVVREAKLSDVVRVAVVSVFPLDDNSKAVTLRMTLQKGSGTLSSEELKECEQGVIGRLGQAGFSLRQ